MPLQPPSVLYSTVDQAAGRWKIQDHRTEILVKQHGEASKTPVRRTVGSQLPMMRVCHPALHLVTLTLVRKDSGDNAALNLSHHRALVPINGVGDGDESQTRSLSSMTCHKPIVTTTTPVETRMSLHHSHCDTCTQHRSLAVIHHRCPGHSQSSHTLSTAHPYSNLNR